MDSPAQKSNYVTDVAKVRDIFLEDKAFIPITRTFLPRAIQN